MSRLNGGSLISPCAEDQVNIKTLNIPRQVEAAANTNATETVFLGGNVAKKTLFEKLIWLTAWNVEINRKIVDKYDNNQSCERKHSDKGCFTWVRSLSMILVNHPIAEVSINSQRTKRSSNGASEMSVFNLAPLSCRAGSIELNTLKTSASDSLSWVTCR